MSIRKIALAAGIAAVVTGCFFDYPDPTVDPATITHNDRAVHDPSVIRDDDGTFYVFGSHLDAARSTDLMRWDYIANGLNAANPLWSTSPLDGTQWTGATPPAPGPPTSSSSRMASTTSITAFAAFRPAVDAPVRARIWASRSPIASTGRTPTRAYSRAPA
jgi:hypothetical protein